ncbi:MAG: YkgJ family cysteine cluster protein [Rhodospirillaceae bacterium]|nr:YkgJ family cysteine cluster protein [Rhodospirillaceae bacterium]MBL6941970.1 YkgJ family cysteine cluster protein [Rhodospirillales bacterium]
MTMDDIPGFRCTSCGTCCLEGAARLQVTEDDIALWQDQAPHILEFVRLSGRKGQRTGEMGRSVHGGAETTRCVWIKKFPGRDQYYCRIYPWRPRVCRRYPTSIEHARFTDCPGV